MTPPPDASSSRRRAASSVFPPRGYTLVEVLITVAVLGILAAVVIPQLGAGATDQVSGAAQIITADLDYARSLAVTNNSTYQIEFDIARNRYVVTHTGANTALNSLPDHPFRRPSADSQSLVVALADFPSVGATVRIVSIVTEETTPETVDSIEFGALGQTTRMQPTIVWLSSAAGAEAIYLPIRVNPATGLATIGDFTTIAPLIPEASADS